MGLDLVLTPEHEKIVLGEALTRDVCAPDHHLRGGISAHGVQGYGHTTSHVRLPFAGARASGCGADRPRVRLSLLPRPLGRRNDRRRHKHDVGASARRNSDIRHSCSAPTRRARDAGCAATSISSSWEPPLFASLDPDTLRNWMPLLSQIPRQRQARRRRDGRRDRHADKHIAR